MNLPDEPLFRDLARVARERADGADPAHDFLHVTRVVANARQIAAREHADDRVCTAAALLHELFNYPKGHPDSRRSGEVCAEHASHLLREHGCSDAFIDPVAYAIRVHPFSLGVRPDTLEGRVLQDADRLDAIGAIGIARCFATCSQMGRPFYNPDDPLCEHREPDDKLWGVDHFYRKLLRIPDVLHTDAARALATDRMRAMETFLTQFGHEIAPG